MTDNQSTILQLLSKALFGREVEIQAQDWVAVLKEAKNQAVVRLVDSVIDESFQSKRKHGNKQYQNWT